MSIGSALSTFRRRRRLAIPLLALVAVAVLAFALTGALAAPSEVSVFPIPGSRVAPPGAQIAFRGVPATRLRKVVVVGSSSGVHAGTVRASSDGRGGSFIPAKPFNPGETVTVTTGLKIRGVQRGAYSFTVATPAGPIPPSPLPTTPRTSADVQRFHSEPALAPIAVTVTKHSNSSAPGDIFIAPQQSPVQNGPMILDQNGHLVWFKPLPAGTQATDFRVQRYQGEPVLTWWQGAVRSGAGVGEDVIFDSSYRQIGTVRAANGMSADLHEFTLTPRGTALITAYYPVWWDASSVHAAKHQVVMDSVVQEIDVKTGLLLFQWDSLDHVPLSDTYTAVPTQSSAPLDHFHVNSVDEDGDGDLLISGRNTSTVYEVDRETARVIWRLGGKRSSFKIAPGTSFGFQHDARVRSDGDRVITLFDNGGGPPRLNQYSRGLALRLDLEHMTATRVAELGQVIPSPADFEGNHERLPGGGAFVGWGQQPYFTEFDSDGQVVLEGRFVDATPNYRAYLQAWSGSPATAPAITTARAGERTTVYASWNGATGIASWRVLAGASPSALKPAATSPTRGFETAIETAPEGYVAVQALDASGAVLATSPTLRA